MSPSGTHKMEKDARAKLAILVAGLGLIVLFFYLYTYDYSLPPIVPSANPDSELRLSLTAGTSLIPPGGSLMATVTVTNISKERITIADLGRPLGLFSFNVTKGGASITGKPYTGLASDLPLLAPETDSVIDLLPGASYSRTFDVAQHYPLARPGKYSISATYSPQAFFTKVAPEGVWIGAVGSDSVPLTVSSKAPQ